MDPMHHGEFRWHLNGDGRNEYPHHHLHPHPHSHPQVINEAILREMEKERIREEIIMSEIVRRRVLEAEVRRELMMEREKALRQGGDGFPFGSSLLMGSESPMRLSLSMKKAGWSAEERLGMTLEDKEKLKRSENGGWETLPFQWGTADLRIPEVKPASEGNKEKDLLTKPDGNVSGSKMEDVTPPEVVNIELLADVIANKKSKEEGCALCQVMTTSEKDLNVHVIGKKHKSKVAAVTAQRTGKNYCIGLFPNKATKSILVEEERVKLKAQSLFPEKEGEATLKKDNLTLSEKSEHLKKTQAEVIGKVQKNEDDPRKKIQKNENDPKKKGCEFWCELCQVGTLSSEVMNNHKLGKKHVSRLRRCEQYGGTSSFNQKNSVVFVHPVEDVSGNGKNVDLGKSNQALDNSEDHMLLDAVNHEERDVKTLDSKVVNMELLDDVIANKKSKEESSCALSQAQEEREEKTSDFEVDNIEFPEVVEIELPADVIANKKSNEGWSCALCQVMTRSEKDLNIHVLGKKHESKVVALRAQTTGKTYSIKLVATNPAKSIYVEKEGVKHNAQSLFSEKAREATLKKDDYPLLETPKLEDLKETQAEVIRKVQKNEDDPRKNIQKNENAPTKQGCEFWCEMCQVGTLSGVVMNAHKLGKKHVSRMRRCEQDCGTGSFNQKKSDVLVDHVEDVSGNGKFINLGELNQALDEVSSEDHMLLDAVDCKERLGKTLDSEVIKNELHADIIESKKSEKEWSCVICQVHEEREGKTLDSELVNIELPEVVNKELPADIITNKKSNNRWSCTLCQVMATSEKDLNEHVLGKKHELKVAALRAHTAGKNYSIKRFAKQPAKSISVEKEGVTLKPPEKAGEVTSKKDDLPSSENPKTEHLKEAQAEVIRQVHKNEDDLRNNVQKNENDQRKKGFEFWCKMCQVGTFSSEVMNAHKLGKKHVSRLRRCDQDGGTGSFNQKKSDVLVDPVEDVSGNGKNINLGEFNQALGEVSSEDRMLLDVVDHEERQGKTLDSKVINIELPVDVTATKKSMEKWSCALCQVSATSEKGLNEHVLGKKHKSKEAALTKN